MTDTCKAALTFLLELWGAVAGIGAIIFLAMFICGYFEIDPKLHSLVGIGTALGFLTLGCICACAVSTFRQWRRR